MTPNVTSGFNNTLNALISVTAASTTNSNLVNNTNPHPLHNTTSDTRHHPFGRYESIEQEISPRSMTSIGRSFFRRESSSIRLFPFPSTQMTRMTASRHPQFRIKLVHIIECMYCSAFFCHRGMKAILLGDRNVELYSTDISPNGIQPVFNDYSAQLCLCLIRDSACLFCGNVVGYHVIKPCSKCLGECNNGHTWMFNQVKAHERKDSKNESILNWSNLPSPEDDPLPLSVDTPSFKPDAIWR